MLSISVPGQPVAKGRPRISTRGGFARAYTPAKTVAYEGLIALAGQEVMDGRELLSGPLSLTVHAIFQQPKGWSKRRRLAALLTPEWHTGRPDADNVLKAVGDGLNGIVWRDDSQLATCKVTKAYGETPGLTIRVAPL